MKKSFFIVCCSALQNVGFSNIIRAGILQQVIALNGSTTDLNGQFVEGKEQVVSCLIEMCAKYYWVFSFSVLGSGASVVVFAFIL